MNSKMFAAMAELKQLFFLLTKNQALKCPFSQISNFTEGSAAVPLNFNNKYDKTFLKPKQINFKEVGILFGRINSSQVFPFSFQSKPSS